MKILKTDSFISERMNINPITNTELSKANDAFIQKCIKTNSPLDPNGHYTPKTELELVSIVHCIFGDRINKKQKISEQDVDCLHISLDYIKDVSEITLNILKRHSKLDSQDCALLYLLGLDDRDIANDVYKIEIIEADYSCGFYELYADASIITPFEDADDITVRIFGECNYRYYPGRPATYWEPEEYEEIEIEDECIYVAELNYGNEVLDVANMKFPAKETLTKLLNKQHDISTVFDMNRLQELAYEEMIKNCPD